MTGSSLTFSRTLRSARSSRQFSVGVLKTLPCGLRLSFRWGGRRCLKKTFRFCSTCARLSRAPIAGMNSIDDVAPPRV